MLLPAMAESLRGTKHDEARKRGEIQVSTFHDVTAQPDGIAAVFCIFFYLRNLR